MSINKIASNDLVGIGVIGLEDSPGLSKADMQAKFEETSRQVLLPKINELIDEYNKIRGDVDDLVVTGGAVTATEKNLWNSKSEYSRNLLSNGEWAYGLVNQRRHSGAIANDYCIDRWIGNGTVTPVSGQYVTLAARTVMQQILPIRPRELYNKKVRVSVETDNGVFEGIGLFPASASSSGGVLSAVEIGGTFSATVGFFPIETGNISGVPSNAAPVFWFFSSVEANIKRVCMTLWDGGESPGGGMLPGVSSATSCPAAEFTTIKAECQSHYISLDNTNLVPLGHGFMGNSTSARILIPTPVTMRDVPNVEIKGGSLASLAVVCNGQSYDVTGIEGVELMSNGVALRLAVSGASANHPCVLRIKDAARFCLNAEMWEKVL